jgi:Protein of unknown function (DUF3443)
MLFARTEGVRGVLISCLCASLALAVGCGGGGSNGSNSNNTVTPTQNTQPIMVNGGPPAAIALSGTYPNGAFTSVTVCVPGSTTSCQSIDGVLVDTGSVGLRLLSSLSGGELTLSLPKASILGNPLGECVQFVDFSFLWGPVETADVKIAGEVATSVPVNVVGDTTFNAGSGIPGACGVAGGNDDDDTLARLGANGILGVGSFAQDCGGGCVTSTTSGGTMYYQCTSSGCIPSLVSLAQQVQNPVSLFASDNNGVIIQLPAATSPQPSLTGSMVFGIGTQANNALGSATVLTLDNNFNITTKFNGSTMSNSFIDSGSNGFFFDDNSITACQIEVGFYCPPSPLTGLPAVNTGFNGANSTITFGVVNAETAFNNSSSDAVFPNLAGPSDGTFTSFDFGLPFFYGRNVYTSIQGAAAPGGQTPYWAY